VSVNAWSPDKQGNHHRVVLTTTGSAVRAQLLCLYAVGLLARSLRYRGFAKVAYALGTRVFDPRNNAVVALDSFGKLRLYLRDGYWIPLLFSDFRFEPEVEVVLAHVLARKDVFFLDCGANIGYWSLIASSTIEAPDRVLGIEASPLMFERLSDTAGLNENRFRCLSAAVWSEDNATLEIVSHDQRHAGSSVVNRTGKRRDRGYRVDEVRSVTLDSIGEQYIEDGLQVVIKLDVEGAEIPALRGAEKLLLERRPLLIYEDHGNDPTSKVTQFVMRTLGMQVYHVNGKSVVRINDIATINSMKTQATVGYNFVACSSESSFASALASLSL
jgi:FkbM family methyltransferase